MGAIFKRELSSYFNSAIAYITIAVFLGFSGFYFMFSCFMYNSSSLFSVFMNMFTVSLFLIPLITMKSFSEEKRQKTEQALLTSPISLFEIVMGKFLASFFLFALSSLIFVVFGIVITIFTPAQWTTLICSLIGFWLVGAALIAIEIFFSALTDLQVISAVLGLALGMLISFWEYIVSSVSIEWLSSLLRALSFSTYLSNFCRGLLDLSGVVFFLSLTALFIFLTIRVFEKRRWS